MIEYYYIDYFENKRKILSIQNFDTFSNCALLAKCKKLIQPCDIYV